MTHSPKKTLVKDFDYEEKIKSLFRNFNLKKYAFESYEDFIKSLPLNYSNIQNSEKYHRGTIHALPQLYAISKSFKLIEENLLDYDLIFRCRYDCLFIHPLNLHKIHPLLLLAIWLLSLLIPLQIYLLRHRGHLQLERLLHLITWLWHH